MHFRTRDFSIAGAWLVFDQVTKALARVYLDRPPVVVIPRFFRLLLSHNTGALFGILGGWPQPWRFVALTALPAVAVFAIGWFLWRCKPEETFGRLGLALILGGAVGNVADRIAAGHVVDFLDFYGGFEPLSGWLIRAFGTNRWPTFNVADIGLTCGAALLMYELTFRARKD